MNRASAKVSHSSSSRTRYVAVFHVSARLCRCSRWRSQSSAQAALALNNHELKKRHISVTVAEKRAAGTARYVLRVSDPAL